MGATEIRAIFIVFGFVCLLLCFFIVLLNVTINNLRVELKSIKHQKFQSTVITGMPNINMGHVRIEDLRKQNLKNFGFSLPDKLKAIDKSLLHLEKCIRKSDEVAKTSKHQIQDQIDENDKVLAEILSYNTSYFNKQDARINTFQSELDCIVDGGHDYSVFDDKIETCEFGSNLCDITYTYKCSNCGKTKDYTWDKLTVSEQKALIAIGLGE